SPTTRRRSLAWRVISCGWSSKYPLPNAAALEVKWSPEGSAGKPKTSRHCGKRTPMARQDEGTLAAPDGRFANCVSRFNGLVTEPLLKGALEALLRHGVPDESIDVYKVPGSFELLGVVGRLAKAGEHVGIICLGAIVRGGTPHFDYLAAGVTRELASVAASAQCAVTFGVLTCDTIEQAFDRAGGKAGNKGAEAATACLEAAQLHAQISARSAKGRLSAMGGKKK